MKKLNLMTLSLLLFAGEVFAQTQSMRTLKCVGRAKFVVDQTVGNQVFSSRVDYLPQQGVEIETKEIHINYRDPRDRAEREITVIILIERDRYILRSEIKVLNLTTRQTEVHDAMEMPVAVLASYKTKLYQDSRTNDLTVNCEFGDYGKGILR